MNSFLFFLNYKTSTLKGNALFYQYYNSIIIMVVVNTVVSDFFWLLGMQHAKLPCPSLSPRVCSHSCPLSHWCHPTVSSSVTCFSSCPQSFPVSGSFPMSWLFTSGSQSIGASASVLPMNIQGWFPLGLTGLISLLSKGHSRVFPYHHNLKA